LLSQVGIHPGIGYLELLGIIRAEIPEDIDFCCPIPPTAGIQKGKDIPAPVLVIYTIQDGPYNVSDANLPMLMGMHEFAVFPENLIEVKLSIPTEFCQKWMSISLPSIQEREGLL